MRLFGLRTSIGSTWVGKRCLLRMIVSAILVMVCCNVIGQPQEPTLPPACGTLHSHGQYGPFDYRVARADTKKLVEGAHFDREWAAHLKGKDTVVAAFGGISPTAGGFDYVLRAFPNHHRALKAMDEIGARKKAEKFFGASFPLRCYFQRAIAFVPDDGLVHALYGAYFAKRGAREESRAELERAHELAPDSVNVQAQLASSYIQMQEWARAELHARVAYRYGYPLPGLREKLKANGHWSE